MPRQAAFSFDDMRLDETPITPLTKNKDSPPYLGYLRWPSWTQEITRSWRQDNVGGHNQGPFLGTTKETKNPITPRFSKPDYITATLQWLPGINEAHEVPNST